MQTIFHPTGNKVLPAVDTILNSNILLKLLSKRIQKEVPQISTKDIFVNVSKQNTENMSRVQSLKRLSRVFLPLYNLPKVSALLHDSITRKHVNLNKS